MTNTHFEDIVIENVYLHDFYRQLEVVNMTDEFAGESSIYRNLGFDKDKFRYYIQGLLNDGFELKLARINGEAAGYCLYIIEDMYITRFNFEIMTIYTNPRFRARGVDRKLIQEMIRLADEKDCAYSQVSICAHFEEDRDRVNRLTANVFAKFGFEDIGIIMGRKGPNWR